MKKKKNKKSADKNADAANRETISERLGRNRISVSIDVEGARFVSQILRFGAEKFGKIIEDAETLPPEFRIEGPAMNMIRIFLERVSGVSESIRHAVREYDSRPFEFAGLPNLRKLSAAEIRDLAGVGKAGK